MQHLKHRWKRLPSSLRRPLVLLVGLLLILLSALIGWVPGPGGMIPFLLGIAVLATEFEWAQRLKNEILSRLKQAGGYATQHRILTAAITAIGLLIISIFAYAFYTNTI